MKLHAYTTPTFVFEPPKLRIWEWHTYDPRARALVTFADGSEQQFKILRHSLWYRDVALVIDPELMNLEMNTMAHQSIYRRQREAQQVSADKEKLYGGSTSAMLKRCAFITRYLTEIVQGQDLSLYMQFFCDPDWNPEEQQVMLNFDSKVHHVELID